MPSVILGWGLVSGASAYRAYRSTSAGVQGALITTVSTNSAVDTTVAPSTTYYYGVTSMGPGGESALSAQSSITTSGGTAESPDEDFVYRRTAPGVFRWFDFDTVGQLGSSESVYQPDPYYEQGKVRLPSAPSTDIPFNWPEIDTAIKASGAGSLRLTIPSSDVVYSTMDGPCGYWSCNFTPSPGGVPDPYVPFGPNSEFYVQVKMRWDAAMCSRIFTYEDGGSEGEGVKLFDVTAGDHLGKVYGSSSSSKIVVHTYYQGRAVQIYRYDSWGNNGGLWWTSQNFQPGGPYHTICDVYSPGGTGDPARYTPNCFSMMPDEWITFQLGVTLGAAGTFPFAAGVRNCWVDSTVKLWATRESTGVTELIIDWNPSTPNYEPLMRAAAEAPDTGDQMYGRVNLFSYMTNIGGVQPTGPECHVHYDELIISSQRIPDPGTAPPPVHAGHPSLIALADNTVLSIPPIDLVGPAGEGDALVKGMCVYSSFAYDKVRHRNFLIGGGHNGTNYDGLATQDLDDLLWKEIYTSNPTTNFRDANYDFDKGAWVTGPAPGPYPRPAARHSSDAYIVVGDELIQLAKVEGNGIAGLPPEYADPSLEFHFYSDARVAHYNILTNIWTFTATQAFSTYPAVDYDPISGLIIVLGQVGLETYNPVTHARAMIISWGGASDRIRDESGFLLAPLSTPFTEVTSITQVGGVATATTAGPHHYLLHQRIDINGINEVEYDTGDHGYITSIPAANQFTYGVDPSGPASATSAGTMRVTLYDPFSFSNCLIYYPPDQKFYLFEHLSRQWWRVDLDRADLANSWITLLSFTGTQVPSGVIEIGFALDTQHNIFGGGLIDNKMYFFNPVTKVWTNQTVLGGTPGTMASNAIMYDELSNCYIFNQYYDGYTYEHMWAYKYTDD